ncbi:MAG: hypothetical protein JOZ77_08460 [Candidatus Eremiobacteraeota bacterium]|nr:hypothetical protein [Candidatus Eremiobacteraeota bacterium]
MRKTAKKAAKGVGGAAKKAGKSAQKAVSGAAKRAKAVASNPRRTVRKAANNVHETAVRARDVGDSVVAAGELIRETADFVDSIAQRAKQRRERGGAPRKKS